MAGIDVSGLSISFPIYHGDSRTLKKSMANAVSGMRRSGPAAHLQEDARQRVIVSVLNDISFRLNPGDRLGLIGGNGAGKTTLLRALAGIYEPVVGRVRVSGTMGTLLDTNLGMNPELTGAENVRLRCLFFGISRTKTAQILRDVEDFAELGAFLDMPVKTYSSGMVVRLAFGLATAIAPQVLLMDEWFMAGDATFIHKARARLESLVEQAEILVVSSHQPEIMRQWCTRLIWLENGVICMDGAPEAVLDAYLSA
ncbi:ABC transporter ATP-binding protein [Kozakia baliensis]|uniref:ABC transporter ATP-binding protein n=1 Tax=Kozakia baliensis TaxID=153496 RepID=UPI00345B81B0